MDPKPTGTPQLNHHWPQYGMKTLMLGLTVTCLVLGMLGGRLKQAHEQRQLFADIARLGGAVGYDTRNMKKTNCLVRVILGTDLTANVELIHLTARPATAPSHSASSRADHRSIVSNSDLLLLQRFLHLRVLFLSGTEVSDRGLAHIKGLTELRCLNLNATQITDAGLTHLRGLHDLRQLFLNRTKITGTGLSNIRKMKCLEILSLQETGVSDAGLSHLPYLPALTILNLDDTNVTDAGIMHLRDLATLRLLYVERTQVTDEGIEALKQYLPYVKPQYPRGSPENRYPTSSLGVCETFSSATSW